MSQKVHVAESSAAAEQEVTGTRSEARGEESDNDRPELQESSSSDPELQESSSPDDNHGAFIVRMRQKKAKKKRLQNVEKESESGMKSRND